MLFPLLLLSACNRHVSKGKTETHNKEQKTIAVSDTGKIKTEATSESTTRYGDSLSGSLYFSDSPAPQANTNSAELSDSIESTGIKVKVTLTRTLDGIKAKIDAVAKPVLKTDKATLKKEESKGLSGIANTTSEGSNAHSEKEVTNEAELFEWFLLILLIALFVWRIFKKW